MKYVLRQLFTLFFDLSAIKLISKYRQAFLGRIWDQTAITAVYQKLPSPPR
jgi:hypothetical protein